MAISKSDLAILKLSYTPEEFGLLESAIAHDPALVATAVTQAVPANVGDIAAYDRIICSLFVYARDEYENSNQLPYWAEEWFDKHFPNEAYRDFYECALFNGNSRYNGIKLLGL
ncbi:hypothetical protein [Agrobacterium tumefaciens]|jgi:hypothetical protein|uniref:hypothetical protein n=1 Tax=Agrobacterium tumefaciens TaxID=358 RepID=UPI000DCFC72F|nr:hypothetical protein FY143_19205 [Agrobacterium tumefaciens]UXT83573.1 hypothetical protein FY131_19080 [Agrobacterium tumefaciens]